MAILEGQVRTKGFATLLVGDKVVWSNPDDLGHFMIKLRKQLHEELIMQRIDRRWLRWVIAVTGGSMDADLL